MQLQFFMQMQQEKTLIITYFNYYSLLMKNITYRAEMYLFYVTEYRQFNFLNMYTILVNKQYSLLKYNVHMA